MDKKVNCCFKDALHQFWLAWFIRNFTVLGTILLPFSY